MSSAILIAGNTPDLEDVFRTGGVVSRMAPDVFEAGSLLAMPFADVLVVDVRGRPELPRWIGEWKRRHTATPVILVLGTPDPGVILAAMRSGITECLLEPLTRADAVAALARVSGADGSTRGEVFAFVGAKGGVGTTTVAANVAVALARIAGGTLFVDLNITGGDAALMLGAEPRFSVVDAIENTHRADETFFRGLLAQGPHGLQVLASPAVPFSGAIDPARLRSLIEFVRARYRYTVLDVPRTSTAALEALKAAGKVVIVANQEVATVRGAATVASAIRDGRGIESVAVVLNRYDSRAALEQQEVEDAIGLPVIARFPGCYRAIVEAANAGEALGAHSEPGRAFERFAREFAHVTPATPGRFGVLSRMASALNGAL